MDVYMDVYIYIYIYMFELGLLRFQADHPSRDFWLGARPAPYVSQQRIWRGMAGKPQSENMENHLQFQYPLVNCYITMEQSTIFNGKTHYKWPFSIDMLNYQRVIVMGCNGYMNPYENSLRIITQHQVLTHLLHLTW